MLCFLCINRYFAVVGVLEEFDKSLEVLEAYVPYYFRDAKSAYHDHVKVNFHENRNTFKKSPPKQLLKEIAKNFTLETEFYHFCKQRLHRQHQLLLL